MEIDLGRLTLFLLHFVLFFYFYFIGFLLNIFIKNQNLFHKNISKIYIIFNKIMLWRKDIPIILDNQNLERYDIPQFWNSDYKCPRRFDTQISSQTRELKRDDKQKIYFSKGHTWTFCPHSQSKTPTYWTKKLSLK